MIQDIYPYVMTNHYNPNQKAKKGDKIFYFENNQIITKPDGRFFQYEDCPNNDRYIYLFSMGTHHFFLSDLRSLEHTSFSARQLRYYEPQFLGFAALTALHLFHWYQDNQYCGKCGQLLQLDKKERALRCPHCQHVLYPKISPAIIVAIINSKNQLLVTKYAQGDYQKYALVAGYSEIGETIEQTVIREVQEETGLKVKNIRYYKSQPWGFSSSLLFGFFAQVDGDESIHMDTEELRLARWADPSEDLDTNGVASLTGEMVELFLTGRYKDFYTLEK
ncbi:MULTISPECIES: NAD(+) diphosphatase [Terrabacteria group]|uniref:NAD(+) diphosphatase n=1 Tax=Bacillati TaxID=1783272 RepID=UPI00193A32B0|nr:MULTISPECIES: NAD(+) diphosphatase [Terrabacteria group]MBW9212721.1 NAD(+) diphosphatase [Trueperella sp. zg.1013]QRG86548.1 NAD(+) diphosphatase [Bulleidia sp. zg-1006]